MRVNPAALHATAATLATITAKAAPPAIPPSNNPVSAAATAQFNTHAATVAAMISHAAALASRAAATYTATAHEYTASDANYSAAVANALNAITDINEGTTTPPVIAEPAPTVAIPAQPLPPPTFPHPPNPTITPAPAEVVAASLHTGDQGASMGSAAQTWRAVAATLTAHHHSLRSAASDLEANWHGESSALALGRLRPFAAWFAEAATAASAVAANADRIVAAHHQAVTAHPTEQTVISLRHGFAAACAQAAAGNPSAAAVAADYRKQLATTQTTSTQVMTSYATHASVPESLIPAPPSPVTPGPGAGDTNEPGRGKSLHDDHAKSKAPGDTDTSPDARHTKTPDSEPNPADGHEPDTDPTAPDLSVPVRPPDTPLSDEVPTPMAVMPMIAGLGQPIGQAAQTPAAAMSPPQVPQAPQVPQMPTSPQTPSTPSPASPAGDPPPTAIPPISPASTDGPVTPTPATSGGGLSPSGPTTGTAAPQTPLPAPTKTLTAATGAPTGPSTGVAAGMPMGAMPPRGQGSDNEKERDPALAADEPIYTEDRPHTKAFIDGTIGPPPPHEIKEQ